MRAAVLHDFNGTHRFEEVTLSDPLPGEVRIRTVASGVCHSDVFGGSGSNPALGLPMILGHEAAGVVTAVGAGVSYVEPGDHVVVCPGGACGVCIWCARGQQQHCTDNGRERAQGGNPRASLDGAKVTQFSGVGSFAEEMLVSERSVARISREMPLDKAALLGCAVITGFGVVRHSAQVSFGQTVAVIGCGGVGLNAVQAAAMVGASRVIAVDRLPGKLGMARTLGATDVVNSSEVDPVEAVVELSGGGVDHVIEVVGRPSTIEQAFGMLGMRGTATVVGLARPGDLVSIPAAQLLAEKRLQGSRLGGTRLRLDIPLYAQMYLNGRLKLDELLSEHIGLADIDSALEALNNPVGARSVVQFD